LNIKELLYFIRVRQWYKNVIVFLPLIFSFQFFQIEKFIITLTGFIILSIISSGMYVRNDIKDLESDKCHPLKKTRALSAGIISSKTAWMIFVILIAIGLGFGLVLNYYFGVLLILMMINIEMYSRWTKYVVFLDAFSIGGNFIIRAISGVVLISSSMSPWLIMGVFFVALFLAFIKRKAELESLKDIVPQYIKNLKDYSSFSLNTTLTISAVMIIVTYSLYAIHGPNNDWRLVITIPIIIFLVFRQLHLSSIKDKIAQTNEILKDEQSRYALILLAISILLLIYYSPNEWFSN
jgi:4-hydroxybenzoate polyprenyltransferase